MLHIRAVPSPKLPRPSSPEVLRGAAPHFPGNLSMNKLSLGTTQEHFWMEETGMLLLSAGNMGRIIYLSSHLT